MSAVGDVKVRFIIATEKIRGNHITDLGLSDEEIIRQQGFTGWNEYWHIALAQEIEVLEFVRLLETHLLDPARTAKEIKNVIIPIRNLVMSSLGEAFKNRRKLAVSSARRRAEPHRTSPASPRSGRMVFAQATRQGQFARDAPCFPRRIRRRVRGH